MCVVSGVCVRDKRNQKMHDAFFSPPSAFFFLFFFFPFFTALLLRPRQQFVKNKKGGSARGWTRARRARWLEKCTHQKMPSYVLQRKVFEGVRWSDEQRRVAWEDAYQSAKGRGSGHPKKKAKEKSDDGK